MKGFLGITQIQVPWIAVQDAHAHLRRVGHVGMEGFALWVGRLNDQVFEVTQAIIPVQRGVRTDQGVYVSIDRNELHRINVWLFQNKLALIGQIHSHPGAAYHSDTDDDYPIATTAGSISIVVPNFARDPFNLDQCAVYRLDETGSWCDLETTAASLICIGT